MILACLHEMWAQGGGQGKGRRVKFGPVVSEPGIHGHGNPAEASPVETVAIVGCYEDVDSWLGNIHQYPQVCRKDLSEGEQIVAGCG